MDRHVKKAKASASSSSTATSSGTHIGGSISNQDQAPLPPLPVRPNLHQLPDVAYEVIEYYLTDHDMSRMMATCQRLLEVHCGRVKEVTVNPRKVRGA